MKTILFFEPRRGGHRAEYFAHLADCAASAHPDARLVFVTPHGFLAAQPGIGRSAAASEGRIEIHEITAAEDAALNAPAFGRLGLSFRLRRLLADYGRRLRPDHIVILDLTPVETALCFAGLPCPWSAILMVQYPECPPVPGLSFRALRQTAKFRWKEWKTARLLRTGNLRALHLFHGDQAADYLNRRFPSRAVFHSIPDPLMTGPMETDWSMREAYGIPAGRRLFLLAGALSDRKGARLFLDALESLPPETAAHSAFLVCGTCEPGYELVFVKKWEQIRRLRPDLLLVSEPSALPLPRWKACFAQCDVVLLPYLRPEYSSGVLGHAVEAGRPVIGPEAGLLGRLIRTHGLGEAVAMDAAALASAMARLATSPVTPDPAGREAYLARCSARDFARQLLSTAGVSDV